MDEISRSFEEIYKDNDDFLRRSIEEGFDVNQYHPRAGTTPLQLALQGNALRCIRLLLEARADPNKCYQLKSRVSGRLYAVKGMLQFAKSDEARSLLLSYGAKENALD